MSELHQMNEHLQSIDKRLDKHIAVVEVLLENQKTALEDLYDTQAKQSEMFAATVKDISKTFEGRITKACERVEHDTDRKIRDLEGKGKMLAVGVITTLSVILSVFKIFEGKI